ncbi:MAG: hypothetical protein U5K51_00600 [Flavobacteriaceae bacterium]|nr:hypothetical protein [Flavobacteriaceae bacterium]
MTILLSGCEPKSSGEQTSAGKGGVILLSPKELKQFPENVQLIDVRTEGEYQRAH